MNILIIGGGIAGLTLAAQLVQSDHSVQVAEKAFGLRTEGYMIDFFGAGYDAAEKMGLLGELEKIHYPISGLNIKRSNGTIRYSLSYSKLRKLADGRHFNFMRGDLEYVLSQRIKNRVSIMYNTTIQSVWQDEQNVYALLSDGTEWRGDLLVGADGIRSKVRELAFGDAHRFIRLLGLYTAAFTFQRTDLYRGIENSFDLLAEPGRQISVYPLTDNRMAVFFLFRSNETNSRVMRRQALSELTDRFGDMGWLVPDILRNSETASDFYFDAVAQVEVPHWTNGRIALVGDACYAVSLLAGQGASLAMAGSYTLAQCLRERDVPSALTVYETSLKPQITEVQRSARNFANFFFPDTTFQLFLRDVGLRASMVPVLQTYFKFKSIRLPELSK
ncbi:2-polyprenyl-6-methoxyphenol hydroxylase-like FAD-dependent oxidoreductase [Planomicrobium soli]|uniref:2-polyprenyl-6-methoxyphenol hydroxylase-like FAD-dependent oxidoreductase n=1 Tax=Planomicrobium soli TaxID=1176648 RepID=A0A2P8H4E1_9BACL|nr:FAD-dependent monooxygenase [Planomicrobium soli]PSL41069.1 2-polyprenyl-6-methoxyphenol hydroxylase-like FAD-dependent oxidoreductase [Planomicrobium soli]